MYYFVLALNLKYQRQGLIKTVCETSRFKIQVYNLPASDRSPRRWYIIISEQERGRVAPTCKPLLTALWLSCRVSKLNSHASYSVKAEIGRCLTGSIVYGFLQYFPCIAWCWGDQLESPCTQLAKTSCAVLPSWALSALHTFRYTRTLASTNPNWQTE